VILTGSGEKTFVQQDRIQGIMNGKIGVNGM